jgi:hypothetical protein
MGKARLNESAAPSPFFNPQFARRVSTFWLPALNAFFTWTAKQSARTP